MPSKKLAIVTPGYYEQMTGGSEYQSYLLAEAAKEAGLAVHHIYIAFEAVKTIPNALGIYLYPLPSPWYRKYVRGLGNTACMCIPQAWRMLKKIQPDCVYCRSGVVQAGMAAYYSKHSGCKSIWHVASLKDVIPTPLVQLIRPLNLLERIAVRYAIHHSTHVVTQARYQTDLLMKNYGRRSEVILSGQLEPVEKVDKGDPIIVAWVANLKPIKQPEMFVRLAEKFRQNERVRFVMVGRPSNGESQNKLLNSMKGLTNLQYLGERSIEEVNQLLAKAHVFVNTSSYEGFANSFIQAWMRGVPVVSMLFDPDDINVNQKIGFLSGSFEQMVRDVATLIDNPDLREAMGSRARIYALEHHSLSRNMGRLLELIVS